MWRGADLNLVYVEIAGIATHWMKDLFCFAGCAAHPNA